MRTPRNIFTNIPRAYRGADTMYVYGYIVLSQRPKPRNVYHLPPHFGKHLFLVRGGICLKLSEQRIAAILDFVKAGIDLPIVARPTLDSREVLTRIAQKETRRVMVFEREREKRRDI